MIQCQHLGSIAGPDNVETAMAEPVPKTCRGAFTLSMASHFLSEAFEDMVVLN